ncbi:GCN5-related N-acetyltransferase protein (plasmid) [Rhizobium etli 8C-3]|uniref:GCN5-related N-acetyltransferase protein n=2 Tax=Rhizobium TaxID=379 RepID=A0A1L5PDB0_RHIET|nr:MULTISPECIES: GNAT family N-acetyltransferase [Rhizobium]APO78124.1 GCN5-related N-acetyltransferase protein [Rhizobium etli 8C-3]TCU40897.1 ribosomal protein S18 acetylase RimI-like enzyme [Rhizobium azibense]
MPIEFRRITHAEAAQSAAIMVEAYAEPPWSEKWSIENAAWRLDELAKTPGCIGVAAFEAIEAIGFAFALPHTSVIGRGLHLAEIAVLPKHQRKGVGSGLLSRLQIEARAMGYLQIWLVSQQSGRVANYYTGNGYEPSNRLGVYSKRLD